MVNVRHIGHNGFCRKEPANIDEFLYYPVLKEKGYRGKKQKQSLLRNLPQIGMKNSAGYCFNPIYTL